MAEPTLYERLDGIFAIAAVVDNLSDRLLKNPKIVHANPELHEWDTVTYHVRLSGLKWLRTLWPEITQYLIKITAELAEILGIALDEVEYQ